MFKDLRWYYIRTTSKHDFFGRLNETVTLSLKRLYESTINELKFLRWYFKKLYAVLTYVHIYGLSQ